MNLNVKQPVKAIISVIGASEISKEIEEQTIQIGRLLALNNYAVACGGLSGVMEAICKGVKQEGGLTIGIIPYTDKSNANRYVDIVIPCPFSQARNIVVVLAGIGSIGGAFFAGLILGVVEAVGAIFMGPYTVALGLAIFLLILIFRPRGLFGKA